MNPPIPNQFDPANAAALVQFAADAYSPGQKWPGTWLSDVIESKATDTRVALYESESDLIVAFRGTIDFTNWRTDLDCRHVSWNKCKIHAGFWRALELVYADLNRAVFAPGFETRRIWLTGHSLGGALAMLYAWRVAETTRRQPFAGVYTFGQPRVGDAAFRDSWPFQAGLNACAWRVVNAADIVPHVPWLCGRYRHAGHEIFYDSAIGSSAISPTIDRSAPTYALDDFFAMLSEFLNPASAEAWLADHHIARYQALFANYNFPAQPVQPCQVA